MKRIGSFDFLRFIAAIIIVFHHYEQVIGVVFSEKPIFYGGDFYFGYMVEFFFLLSGFLLAKNIKQIQEGMSFKSFFGKKYGRLFPLLLLSVIVYEVLLYLYNCFGSGGPTWPFSTQIDIWGTVITAIGIQAGWVFPRTMINSPVWYISVLLLCYIFFYLAVRVCAMKKINPTYVFVFLILLGVGIDTYEINLPFFNSFTARGLDPLFFGVLLGVYFEGRDSKKSEIAIGTVLSIIVILCIIYDSKSVENGLEHVVTFLLYPSIIVIFNSATIKKIFNFKFFEVLGNTAYSIFVWHMDLMLAMYLVIAVFDLDVCVWTYKGMFLFTAICFAVGLISYYFIDRPIANQIHKRCVWTK